MITKDMTLKNATRVLKSYFPGGETLEVAVEDIFQRFGRGQMSTKDNMAWLSNKLPLLRKFNLITSVYSHEGRRRLIGIKLTEEGQKIIGINGQVVATNPPSLPPTVVYKSKELSVGEIMDWVTTKRKEYPGWNIIFKIAQADE